MHQTNWLLPSKVKHAFLIVAADRQQRNALAVHNQPFFVTTAISTQIFYIPSRPVRPNLTQSARSRADETTPRPFCVEPLGDVPQDSPLRGLSAVRVVGFVVGSHQRLIPWWDRSWWWWCVPHGLAAVAADAGAPAPVTPGTADPLAPGCCCDPSPYHRIHPLAHVPDMCSHVVVHGCRTWLASNLIPGSGLTHLLSWLKWSFTSALNLASCPAQSVCHFRWLLLLHVAHNFYVVIASPTSDRLRWFWKHPWQCPTTPWVPPCRNSTICMSPPPQCSSSCAMVFFFFNDRAKTCCFGV